MNKIERSVPRLESDILRSFIAVAEHGNITRAAEDLLRTQSAISVQIKRLETEVGQPLFIRQARGMVLTPPGERLLTQAKRIVSIARPGGSRPGGRPHFRPCHRGHSR